MTPFENIKNKILLTFDIEDGISLSMRDNFNTLIPQTNRVVIYTELILGILAEYDVKSTFFILGQVAEKFPSLIKTISNEGHELAVHGYDHFTLNKLNPKKALQEVTRAKKLIEDISGLEVYGHRAPAFSLTEKTSWMFDVLVEAGFMYDSSVLPANLGAFKWPEFENKVSEVITRHGNSIIEVPISTWEIGGFSVPYSGGGYLRLIPEFLLKRLFVKELKRDHVIHYMHPYEIDQERYPDYYFEALANSSLKKSLKMRSYWLNRSSLPSKLRMLSENFQSAKIIDLVNGVDSKPVVKL